MLSKNALKSSYQALKFVSVFIDLLKSIRINLIEANVVVAMLGQEPKGAVVVLN
jgi:hypothetical protein